MKTLSVFNFLTLLVKNTNKGGERNYAALLSVTIFLTMQPGTIYRFYQNLYSPIQ